MKRHLLYLPLFTLFSIGFCFAQPAEIPPLDIGTAEAAPPDTIDPSPLMRPMEPAEDPPEPGLLIGDEGKFVRFGGDSLEMDGNKITGLPTPENSDDAATKGYVDDQIPGNGQPKAESENIKLYRN
ncbi:MAG TPA: hypothetical protein ENN75_01415 [candidate division Zixibacteria bacterium]|nr:hypothetical protein [candidate division Zixibacteria bacterium]